MDRGILTVKELWAFGCAAAVAGFKSFCSLLHIKWIEVFHSTSTVKLHRAFGCPAPVVISKYVSALLCVFKEAYIVYKRHVLEYCMLNLW